MVDFQCEIKELPLRDPFGIARGTRRSVRNLFIRIGEGWGEGAPVYYKGQNADEMLELSRELLASEINTLTPETAAEQVLQRHPNQSALAQAVDLAVHDAWGKAQGRPLYELFGANPADAPRSSFTIGLDALDVMLEKVERVKTCPILKIKLGSNDDMAILERIRAAYPGEIFIDANEGWSLEQSIAFLPELKRLGVTLLEQPLPRDDVDAYETLHKANQTGIPLYVDEGVQGPEDIQKWLGRVDGINIKLAKCGGLARARRMIAIARENGLSILLGCMIESSLAISAAAQIAPLVDAADLDGAALLGADPFSGMAFDNGTLTLPSAPGLGATAS